jgi:SH3-like domain-containing protein
MSRKALTTLLIILALPAAAQQNPLNNSGLPIPRFVSLKSEEVNVRTGPGERYPISWVYKRAHWPVEIVEEFDHWRKIRDVEGSEGWILKGLLDGRRTAIVRGKKATPQILHRLPEDSSPPVLRVKPMVIGRLLECSKEWCRLQVDSYKGWIRKTSLWGVYPREEFN